MLWTKMDDVPATEEVPGREEVPATEEVPAMEEVPETGEVPTPGSRIWDLVVLNVRSCSSGWRSC
jgi:hypothetical protein